MRKKLSKLTLNRETLRTLSSGPVSTPVINANNTEDLVPPSMDYSCTVCTLGDCGGATRG